MGFDGEPLHEHVGHVQGGALGRQGAHGHGMQTAPVDVDGHLDAASLGQIRDVPVVADVPVQPENAARFRRFEYARTVFGAPRTEVRGFDRKRIGRGELGTTREILAG